MICDKIPHATNEKLDQTTIRTDLISYLKSTWFKNPYKLSILGCHGKGLYGFYAYPVLASYNY